MASLFTFDSHAARNSRFNKKKGKLTSKIRIKVAARLSSIGCISPSKIPPLRKVPPRLGAASSTREVLPLATTPGTVSFKFEALNGDPVKRINPDYETY